MRWPNGWGRRPAVMGVLNITPDSFSDGGRYFDPSAALSQGQAMVKAGADLLDLGAQSTRPGAEDVGASVEIARLIPVLKALRDRCPELILSVDTFLAPVAEAALAAGADWINDISGGRRDPGMLPLIASTGCPFVLMHSRGDSQTMDALTDYGVEGVVQGVIRELRIDTERALAAGVTQDQLLWDPGLGFAKTTEQNLELIRHLERLTDQGIPVLLGPSRKRFIGAVLDEPRPRARLWGTAAVCSRAVSAGVAVLRVHDVGPIRQIADMSAAIRPVKEHHVTSPNPSL